MDSIGDKIRVLPSSPFKDLAGKEYKVRSIMRDAMVFHIWIRTEKYQDYLVYSHEYGSAGGI